MLSLKNVLSKQFAFTLTIFSISTTLFTQVSITSASLSYSQNFNSLGSTGTSLTWSNNSTITGWYLYNSAGTALTSYIADAGTSTAGSYYSYGATSSSERALGSLASGGTYFGSPASGTAAGYLAVSFTNNTTGTIDTINVLYDGEQWRNGGNTSTQSLVLEYGVGSSFSTVTTWITAGTSFDFTSPVVGTTAASVAGNTTGRSANIGGTISSIGWNSGSTLWIRWKDLNDAGNDHGLAIDSFRFTAITCTPINPSITLQPSPRLSVRDPH